MQMMTWGRAECKMSTSGHPVQPWEIITDFPEDMTCEWVTGLRGLFQAEQSSMCKSLEVRVNCECPGTEGSLQCMFSQARWEGGQRGEIRLQRNTRSLGLILRTVKNHWRVFHREETFNIYINKQTKQNSAGLWVELETRSVRTP